MKTLLNDQHMQTGRTTRMMHDALLKRCQGKTVYVIVSCLRDVDTYHARYNHTGIHFEEIGSIRYEFDWESFTIRGTDPSTVVLVDHYVIEQHISCQYSYLLDKANQFNVAT